MKTQRRAASEQRDVASENKQERNLPAILMWIGEADRVPGCLEVA